MQQVKELSRLDQVEQFHRTMEMPVLDEPAIPSMDRCKLRLSLLYEELQELETAIADGDTTAVADGLADLEYVLLGAVLEFGMKDKFDRLFSEVHRSNMSKTCTREQSINTIASYQAAGVEVTAYPTKADPEVFIVRRDSDNKILKNIDWSSPDLDSILYEYEPQTAETAAG